MAVKKQKTKTKNQKDKPTENIPKKSQLRKSKIQKPSETREKEPQTMDELLKVFGEKTLGLKKGDTVEGTIVSISAKEVFVDIGKKSLGIIAEWELSQVKDFVKTLSVGDKIYAQVINVENELGYTTLSLRKTSIQRRWQILSERKEKGEDLEVVGLEVSKGGLLVDWQGLRGFIPATQLDSTYTSSPHQLIGKKIKVKVLEVDQSLNRLVLSQKAASFGISPTVLKERLAKIKANDVLQGVVSGVAQFGLFVDIDGLEGLVHISEIAWEKVEDPSSVYKVGDKVEVVVLDVNQDEGKLNLSIKRLTPDPWKNILDRYPPDSQVSGKVVRKAPYGYFVTLEPGIEGLIHISKLTGEEEVKIGEEIKCMVENVDVGKRKISLTLIPKEKPVGYR